MVNITNVGQPVVSVSSGSDWVTPLLVMGGFVLFTVLVLGFLWWYESSDNRLFVKTKGVFRKKRFKDKDLHDGNIYLKGQTFKVSSDPSLFKAGFGSPVPAFLADADLAVTLDLVYPDRKFDYPSPEEFNEAVNDKLAVELQTYREKKTTGETLLFIIVGGVAGLFAGIALGAMGVV